MSVYLQLLRQRVSIHNQWHQEVRELLLKLEVEVDSRVAVVVEPEEAVRDLQPPVGPHHLSVSLPVVRVGREQGVPNLGKWRERVKRSAKECERVIE